MLRSEVGYLSRQRPLRSFLYPQLQARHFLRVGSRGTSNYRVTTQSALCY